MKLLLNKIEVGETLSLSQSTIDRMTRENKLPAPIKIGGRVLWRYNDLKEWTERLVDEPKKETRGRKRLSPII